MKGAGELIHLVTVQRAGSPVPDDSGGYVTPYADLEPPQVWASVEGPPAADEAIAGNVERASITHRVEMFYHPEIDRRSRLVLENGRILNVRGIVNEREENRWLILSCEEVA